MPDFTQDRALAPKVFFIDPDPTILSDAFIELAFLRGFETYAIPDDRCGDLIRKVRVLVETYPDLILFFTIDRKGSLKAWTDYLRELQSCGDGCVRIGVLYSEKEERVDQLVKQTFNFDIGITAGTIPLHVSHRRNQDLLLQVLEANQAMGRRKVIRVKCGSTYRMNFLSGKTRFEAALLDLSVSHFSAQFNELDPAWDVGTTLKGVQLRLAGKILMVNALIAIKRKAHEGTTIVFFYHTESGHPAQEEGLRIKVNQIICQHYQEKTRLALEKHFQECLD